MSSERAKANVSKHRDGKTKPGEYEDMEYWMSRLKVDPNNPKALQAWRRQHSGKTYDVLPRPVQYQLNKFFFEKTPKPSRAELKQLWIDLQRLSGTPLEKQKLVKWFQNKRHYMKRVHEQEGVASIVQGLSHSRAARALSSDSEEDDDSSEQESEASASSSDDD